MGQAQLNCMQWSYKMHCTWQLAVVLSWDNYQLVAYKAARRPTWTACSYTGCAGALPFALAASATAFQRDMPCGGLDLLGICIDASMPCACLVGHKVLPLQTLECIYCRRRNHGRPIA